MHFRTTVVTSVNVPAAGLVENLQFALGDVATQLDGLASLYRYYRINKIVVKYVPNINVNNSSANGIMPYVVDFHAPEPVSGTVNLSLAVQQANHRIHNPMRGWSRKFTPALTNVVATSSTGTAFLGAQPKFKQWIETSASGIPHFGYVAVIGPTTASGGLNYQRYVKYYISAKYQQ